MAKARGGGIADRMLSNMVTIVPDDPCVTQAAAWVWNPRNEAGAGFVGRRA